MTRGNTANKQRWHLAHARYTMQLAFPKCEYLFRSLKIPCHHGKWVCSSALNSLMNGFNRGHGGRCPVTNSVFSFLLSIMNISLGIKRLRPTTMYLSSSNSSCLPASLHPSVIINAQAYSEKQNGILYGI